MVGSSNPTGRHPNRDPIRGGSGMRGVVGPNPTPFGEQLREQRRLAGLCFRCGEKYHMGHQCKKQILLLEGDEEPDQEVT